jgi:hypothetical protein
MNRSGLFVLAIMGAIALCLGGMLLMFDPRTKALVGRKAAEMPSTKPLDPGRKLHPFVPDGGRP